MSESSELETTTCPTARQLQAAINGEISSEEQSRLAEHLNGCNACQLLVQQLAGVEDVIPSTAPVNAEETSEALSQVMHRLRRSVASDVTSTRVGDDELLGFLSRPTEAGFIGQFGPYDILELVGRGGMGLVLKAFDRSLNRIVAIKVLLPQLASGKNARQRFLREAQAAAAVIHENVVTIHAVDEHENLPYLVMEYVEGQSLHERIESGMLDVPEILRIGAQISAGLAAAHAQGLVHRDIKPANILLQNGIARVKITDFGLAKAVDDVAITRSGTITGTPQYLSPEQAESSEVDHRTDLFSLGGVIYAMCTGCPPFRGDSTARIIRQVCDHQPRPIAELNDQTPVWLIGIIRRLLEKDPRRRYASADEVGQLLQSRLAMAHDGIPKPAMKKTWWLAAAGLGLTVLGLAFFSSTKWSASDKPHSDTNLKTENKTLPAKNVFRLEGKDNVFSSFEAAVRAAEPNDVIEIASEGPHELELIQINDKPLTIRATDGHSPTLRFTQTRYGLVTDSNLELEGISIVGHRFSDYTARNPLNSAIIKSRGNKLILKRCKVDAKDICGISFDGDELVLQDTVIRTPDAGCLSWLLRPAAELQIDNSVLAGRGSIGMVRFQTLDTTRPCRINVGSSTLVSDVAIRYDSKNLSARIAGRPRLGDSPIISAKITNSIIDSAKLFAFNPPMRYRMQPREGMASRILLAMLDWREEGNYYREQMDTGSMSIVGRRIPFLTENSIPAWQQLFGIDNPQSTEGTIEYEPQDPDAYVVRRLTPPNAFNPSVGATVMQLRSSGDENLPQ